MNVLDYDALIDYDMQAFIRRMPLDKTEADLFRAFIAEQTWPAAVSSHFGRHRWHYANLFQARYNAKVLTTQARRHVH